MSQPPLEPRDFFKHCPRCGKQQPSVSPTALFECPDCGFRYYFNPTVAVAVFIQRHDGNALFIRRAREPAKGRLAPPGGFIDIGETAENAASREVREEVGLEIEALRFLCSQPNQYTYANVTYPVLDLFFTGRVRHSKEIFDSREVESCLWLTPSEVAPEAMALPSMKRALEIWQTQLCRISTPKTEIIAPQNPRQTET
jgi:NADH pyrophosphatase NudC (nudix superfamily)